MKKYSNKAELAREYEASLEEWSAAVKQFGRLGTTDNWKALLKQVNAAAVRTEQAKKALADCVEEKEG